MRSTGHVAIVLSASHQAHYGFASETAYIEACKQVPWAVPQFYAEHTLRGLIQRIADGLVDGVIFASGSLQSAAARQLLSEPDVSHVLLERHQAGVGFAFLHQLLPEGSRFRIGFLPEARGLEIERGAPCSLSNGISSDGIRLRMQRGTNRRQPSLHRDSAGNTVKAWVTYRPLFLENWNVRLWPAGTPQQHLLLTHREVGYLLASSLAFDWNGQTDALASVIARVLRGRGVLVRSTSTTESFEALYKGQLESRYGANRFAFHSKDGANDAYYFLHEFFTPSNPLREIARQERGRIRRQLERGGTVAGYIEGMYWDTIDKLPVFVELTGPLPYAARSAWYAKWMSIHRHELSHGLTFDLRAIAIACSAVRAVFEDEEAIPAGLSIADIGRLVKHAVEQRLGGHAHVDDMIVPTAACCSALLELGCEAEAKPLIEWLAIATQNPAGRRKWLEDDNELTEARVLLWVPPLRTVPRLKAWLDRNGSGDPTIAEDIVALVKATYELHADGDLRVETRLLLLELVKTDSLPSVRRAEIALHLLKTWGSAEVGDLSAVAVILDQILRDTAATGVGFEAVSILTAALVRLDAALPLQIHSRPATSSEDVTFRELILPQERQMSELRDHLREAHEGGRLAERLATKNRRAAMFWLLLFVVLFVAMDAAGIALAIQYGWTDTANSWTIGLAAFGIVSGVIALAERIGRLPPWPSRE